MKSLKMRYEVGSVPYLNAKPLVRYFEDLGDESPVKVTYEVPSRLPAMLASGQVQAIMVSSIEALRSPGRRVAAGVSIGTLSDVLSVRVFSKVHPSEIRSVAFDASSMTSNALTRIILKDTYGVDPSGEAMPPDLEAMLVDHDAGVLIGDNGMREEGKGLHILDLGREWLDLTGLPFVWAVWLGDEALTEELADYLALAEREGRNRLEAVIADAPAHTGLPLSLCRKYLTEIMHYPMYERELEGLREFGRLLALHGLIDRAFEPILVGKALKYGT